MTGYLSIEMHCADDLIELCYASAENPSGYQVLMEELCACLRADTGDFIAESTHGKTCIRLGPNGFDPNVLESHGVFHPSQDLWSNAVERYDLGSGRSEAATATALRHTDSQDGCVEPRVDDYFVGAILENSHGRQAWLEFGRLSHQEPFSEDESVLLNRLAPHLRRSLRLFERFNSQTRAAGVTAAAIDRLAIPLFVLDDHAAVVQMNAAGQRFLNDHPELGLSTAGHLVAKSGWIHARIGAAIHAALGVLDDPALPEPAPVVVPAPEKSRSFALQVTHYCSALGVRGALVLITSSEQRHLPNIAPFARLHKLTKSEKRLVSWLAGGGGLADFAESCGMSTSTARWHLKNVHQKTDTHSIGELVAAALTLSAPFDLI